MVLLVSHATGSVVIQYRGHLPSWALLDAKGSIT